MGKFGRDDRGGSRFGSDRGNRGDRGDRPPVSMHDAICDDCGKKCQVPFKPTGDRPIYCSDCFGEHGGGAERSERRGGGRSFSDRGDRGDRGDRPKFQATCAKCGKRCEVPFRPTGGKPVYCNECFDKGGDEGRGRGRGADASGEQLAAINAKLDRILKMLSSTAADVVSAAGKKDFVPAEKSADKSDKADKKAGKEAKSKKVIKAVKFTEIVEAPAEKKTAKADKKKKKK